MKFLIIKLKLSSGAFLLQCRTSVSCLTFIWNITMQNCLFCMAGHLWSGRYQRFVYFFKYPLTLDYFQNPRTVFLVLSFHGRMYWGILIRTKKENWGSSLCSTTYKNLKGFSSKVALLWTGTYFSSTEKLSRRPKHACTTRFVSSALALDAIVTRKRFTWSIL